MKYTKKIKKEKGKNEQETSFEVGSEIIVLIVLLMIVLILHFFGLGQYIKLFFLNHRI